MIKVQKKPSSGKIDRIEMDAEGLCGLINVQPEELEKWEKAFPKTGDLWALPTGKVSPKAELEIWKKRAALLKTKMSPKAVKNVEEAGLLDSYAALAEDCPEGLTAHVWRSYGAVVFMQVRENKKIGPHELALRARLETITPEGKVGPDVDMAAKHLRLLIAQGLLSENEEDGRWDHQGLPKFFQS